MSACHNPYELKDKHPYTGEPVFVPCGKCAFCVARKISSWSFRLMQEEKQSISAYFVTLTYDTKHVPLTRSGFMSLNKKDVQKFIKRLRWNSGKTEKPIKYFAVGEYGSKLKRPHYHLILFNAQPPEIIESWTIDGSPIGHVYFGHDCQEAAVGYCLKYMHKGPWRPMHKNDDREPEFRLMSKLSGSVILQCNVSNGTEPI